MGSAAVGAGAPNATTPGTPGSANPFWEVTNLFAQKNKQGATAATALSATTIPGGGAVNPGNFLRGLRLLVRSSTGVAGVGGADAPFSVLKNAGLQNTDGATILYGTISGYAYVQRQRFFRPWLRDPSTGSDYSDSTNPAFTLFLGPEVRQQLGALENTDTRSAYQFTYTIAPSATVFSTAPTTEPKVSVTPYADMWAQPDAVDLETVPNQQIPPGVNLQTKTRHQVFTLNPAGSQNSLLSTLTGNAIRGVLLIVRNATKARVDAVGTPMSWQLDARNLGVFSPTILFQWAEDFFKAYGGVARPTGVYPWLRYFNPGTLYGQGWQYTANSTAFSVTFPTATGTAAGTVELVQEEVYAVGAVTPSLIDL
ncbi:MAG: hypothetical protein M0010_15320 [Actinomycetota bacterium]|jgi:hypothetical protein|nr:hypothetical protein [Actinomycetota bacterium]